MTENNLPECCKNGNWIIRDSIRRKRELQKLGFSSLPRIAVCSKCGTTKFIDPGVPDEEYIRRRKYRKNKYQNNNKDSEEK